MLFLQADIWNLYVYANIYPVKFVGMFILRFVALREQGYLVYKDMVR